MVDTLLRPVAERLLRPMVRVLGARVHPTAISVAGLLAGAGCAVLLLRGSYGAALGLWFVNRYLDGLDGGVARAAGRQSDLGGYLDIVFDFAVYAFVPIAAVFALPEEEALSAFVALSFVLASFYVNAVSWLYLSAVIEKRGHSAAPPTSVVMPPGLVEGTETIVLFSLLMLFPGQTTELMWLVAVLVGLTVLQRVFWAARHLFA